MRFSSRTLLGALAASLFLIAAPAAQAGTYTVYGCQTPSAVAAPLDGWHPTLAAPDSYWTGTCPTPMFLGMDASHSHADGAYIEAEFIAPPNTTISSYTIRRAVRLVSGSGYYYQVLDESAGVWRLVNGCQSSSCGSFGDYTNPSSKSNLFSHTAETDTTAVVIKLLCGRSGGCPTVSNGADSVWFFQSAITLEDDYSPQFAEPPTGPLVGGSLLSGMVPVTIAATDQGGGVYQALFEVDGHVVQTQPLDSNGGLCQQPFVAIAPCQPSSSTTVSLDTTQLPDGLHSLRLLVSDAAGNVAAWGPITITTSNNPCSPVPAAGGMHVQAAFAVEVRKKVRIHRRLRIVKQVHFVSQLTTHYRDRPLVQGNLTTGSGQRVAGSPICIAARDNVAGAPLRGAGSVTTGALGGFSYRLARGPSRTVYFISRVPGGAVSQAVRVTTRVPVAVHVDARHLRNGHVMTWSGQLPGPAPGGMLALWQVWRGSYWQTFQQVAVARSGKWSGRYRFEFSTGIQHYKFRLLVPHQTGYPYAANTSAPIRVTVTG